jgi:prevent-host-death family protein
MVRAGIADVKARLSHYLETVRAGDEVLITERGVPVAKIVPLPERAGRDRRREMLVRAGILIPGRGRVRRSLLAPLRGEPAGVVAALLAEREDSR